MFKLVDFEAVQDGENFIFIKALRADGSVDPRIGTKGPYEIMTISRPIEVAISHPEGLTSDLIDKLVIQFTKNH